MQWVSPRIFGLTVISRMGKVDSKMTFQCYSSPDKPYRDMSHFRAEHIERQGHGRDRVLPDSLGEMEEDIQETCLVPQIFPYNVDFE